MQTITPDKLNSIIEGSQSFISKKGDTSTTVVGIIHGDAFGLPYGLWVKRFNYKGFWNFLLKKLFGSRAIRLWYANKKLYEKGLPVPKPINYFEPSFKHKHSFFVCSVIEDSENLGNIYKRKQFHEPEKLAHQLGLVIAQWHKSGAVHGDMKWPNILLQRNGNDWNFFLVDLDQAKLYNKPNLKGIMKDLGRFYRDGLELGSENWVESLFLPEYMGNIPEEIRKRIDLPYIRNRAIKEWHKRVMRRFQPR